MRMPSPAQRKLLERAVGRYQANVQVASGYLQGRGLTLADAEEARLGVVSTPEPGHESAIGRLAIPYMNRLGVIGVKFRCLLDHVCKTESCPKYLTLLGMEPYLYNVMAVESDADTIHITEGELDAIVLQKVLDAPAVGVPGASAWRPHHPWHFRGFERVLVWADGDKAGQDLARMLRKELSTAEVVTMPSGHDVTSLYVEGGSEAIKNLTGDSDG